MPGDVEQLKGRQVSDASFYDEKDEGINWPLRNYVDEIRQKF